MTDRYNQQYLEAIKAAKTDEELSDVIDEIYLDGYQDGADYEENQPT